MTAAEQQKLDDNFLELYIMLLNVGFVKHG